MASVKHYHHYLFSVYFEVGNDHSALRWLLNFRNPKGQMVRWLEVLGTYTYTIEHRAGARHSNADSLSKRPCSQLDTICSHERKE